MPGMGVSHARDHAKLLAVTDPVAYFGPNNAPIRTIPPSPAIPRFSCNDQHDPNAVRQCIGKRPVETLMRLRQAMPMQIDGNFRLQQTTFDLTFPAAVKDIRRTPRPDNGARQRDGLC